MVPSKLLKVCAVLLLACAVPVACQTRCRICTAAKSLDQCTSSVTCGSDEKCYMEEVVTEQLNIEYNAGCRAKDVCDSTSHPIGKRGINKRDSFIACSRCCDSSPTNGRECNSKLCGIKFLRQNSSQCYFCDSTKAGGQGDVQDPTECGTYTTCQTDEVCGAQTFALALNATHRKTCLPRRMCTVLTQRALEDIKRCKDPDNIKAGLCGNRKRSGQMVCSACCGDAACNSGTCDDVLQRLYNLWTSNVLNFQTLKATGTIQQSTTLYSSSPTQSVSTSPSPSTANKATLTTQSNPLSSSSLMLPTKKTQLTPTVTSAKQTLALQTVSTSTTRRVNSTFSMQTTSSTAPGTSKSTKLVSTSATNVQTAFSKSPSLSSSSSPTSSSSSSSSSTASISTTTFTTDSSSAPTGQRTIATVKFTASPKSQTTRSSASSSTSTKTKVIFTASPKQSIANSSLTAASSSLKHSSIFSAKTSLNVLATSKSAFSTANAIQTQPSLVTSAASFGITIHKPSGSEEIIPPTVVNLTPTSMFGDSPNTTTTLTSSSAQSTTGNTSIMPPTPDNSIPTVKLPSAASYITKTSTKTRIPQQRTSPLPSNTAIIG